MCQMKWIRELLDDLKKTFRDNLSSAVIFGSVARGEDFPDSDIDDPSGFFAVDVVNESS